MVQYVEHIIIPYVQQVHEKFEDDTAAVVIIDNSKGQITDSISDLLDGHNIHA